VKEGKQSEEDRRPVSYRGAAEDFVFFFFAPAQQQQQH
jgi:hypothetical protein